MEEFLTNPLIVMAIVLWILPWRGVALWRAAGRKEKKWFIALLILNTLAILEITYIFFFSKRKNTSDGLDREESLDKKQ